VKYLLRWKTRLLYKEYVVKIVALQEHTNSMLLQAIVYNSMFSTRG